MKQYKGTSHSGGGCLHFGRGFSPSLHTMQKPGGRLEGMAWADFGGPTRGGHAAAWRCGGREEQLVPRQCAWVLFAAQLEAEWLRFSGGKLTPRHPCSCAVPHGKGGPGAARGTHRPAVLPLPRLPFSEEMVKRGCASSIYQKSHK